jgi:penicillin amidase
MGWFGVAVSCVLLAVLLLGSLGWLVVMSALPRLEGTLQFPSLVQSATIVRDDLGVPRISAANSHDAYFALGWVHAQDRMWQMEMTRRVGAGRLAELVGEAGLANDRFMRTLGLYALAERSLESLEPQTRAALDAYADGVNAWMKENRLRLPLDYVLLGARPEPWRAADSMVWQKLMALQLAGNWQDDLLRAQLARRLDAKRLQELFPAYPADAPTTLSANGVGTLLAALPEAARTTAASNIWIAAGSRTASGKPILASDPHLGLRAPILWYLAEIEAPGLAVSGATVPGVPFHLIAHNRSIAWGFTATEADTIDLFVEKTVSEEVYKTPDGTRPFTVHDEVIKVKGGPDVVLKVRETRHGPVVSDLVKGDVAGPGEVLTFSSTALSGSDTSLEALHRLNRAGDWAGFLAAAKELVAPVLNIGYADTAGNIGFVTAGRIPIRKSGNGLVPARGWTNEGDWVASVPFAKQPQTYNPKSGLIINANNKVVGEKYPYLITANWDNGYRAQRLRDLLEPKKGLTPADMAAIQADALSVQAVELKDLLTGTEFKSERARAAAKLIADWDGTMSKDRPEPLIYAAWTHRLNRAILADELKDQFASFSPPRGTLLADILTRHRHWCDDVTTPEPESCDDLVAKSLDDALAALSTAWGPDMNRWRWGEAHQAQLTNAVIGKVPGLRLLSERPIATDGDDFTVARGTYKPDEDGTRFPHMHGPGLRAVFDLADPASSRYAIATGQSGQVLSRHYADMRTGWAKGQATWPGGGAGRSVLVLTHGRGLFD